jgi:hypothetical protein
MPTLFIRGQGNTGGRANASTRWTCEVKDLRHAWNLHAREPGGPIRARHEVESGPVEEGDVAAMLAAAPVVESTIGGSAQTPP